MVLRVQQRLFHAYNTTTVTQLIQHTCGISVLYCNKVHKLTTIQYMRVNVQTLSGKARLSVASKSVVLGPTPVVLSSSIRCKATDRGWFRVGGGVGLGSKLLFAMWCSTQMVVLDARSHSHRLVFFTQFQNIYAFQSITLLCRDQTQIL